LRLNASPAAQDFGIANHSVQMKTVKNRLAINAKDCSFGDHGELVRSFQNWRSRLLQSKICSAGRPEPFTHIANFTRVVR
jgi:hypothetical protein